MKRLILIVVTALMLAAFSSGVACAETDTRARNLVKKLEERVDTLENKVTTLQLLVQQLKAENAELQGKVESNFALIKALATQLNQGGP
ncbi:MAG: hypothetical protein KKE73_03380 [Proteobacteria bacterium]|nr:hypothetical protein [Pseudomonadota bacterium]